jgi:hypothetical protein
MFLQGAVLFDGQTVIGVALVGQSQPCPGINKDHGAGSSSNFMP